ncbi:Type 1 glutamine amidotransferase-like domain-containing protein [Planococcus shixiaomingii]|uniref:Type 1 glutamine amidotransferase-like domain-containing protein n=1 Tax=Planococcus shixiaomingii TaxID=3058393 RepID=UPI00262BDE5E|nr:Type 1 glutamine amidotransferase-like domain-containing protein [Planococcus sp. N022]WKA56641.1 Type 1 glutamine amidotransferase-like domain-containing protein [Planococcus sp. N022]
MAALFLSGGGDKEHTEKFDDTFTGVIDKEKPLLYIPIAMKNIRSYSECLEWFTSVFNPLGVQEIAMWTGVERKSLDDLHQFSGVYIGGGNTYSLLQDFRFSKFDAVLTDYIQSGGTVYGGSAGAIILGSNIETCAHLDSNNVGVTVFNGFKLIGNYAIWCHYEPENDELIKNFLHTNQTPVIALPEETGIYIDKEMMKITGIKPATIFSGPESKQEVWPGSESVLL